MLLAGFAAMAALLIFGDFNTVGGRGGAPAAQPAQPAQPARLARFNSSCRAAVTSDLDQGLTLFYAFEYAEARAVFDAVRKADPKCCIASYFAASTLAHPIWSYATDASLNATRAYSLKAARCAADPASNASPRERDYLFALSVYANASGLAPAERLRRHADAMRTVAERHASEDENAGVLYGLSLLAVGYYSEEEPSRQWPHLLAAAAAEEAVLARSPRHPGALHLAIHAYDQPALASRALGLARRYAEVAGNVPHPIHMPSHIYSNLGLWSDVVAANVKSMNAALGRDKAAKGARAASLSSLMSAGVTAADAAAAASTSHQDWSHAAFFLQVGLLNLALDCHAEALARELQRRAAPSYDGPVPLSPGEEASYRVPAHLFIETRQWEAGAAFNISICRAVLGHSPAAIAAACEATEAANASLAAGDAWRIQQLPYFRISYDALVESARAWRAFRADGFEAGISWMERVVALQALSWRPEAGAIWDAEEQLAEMHLIRHAGGKGHSRRMHDHHHDHDNHGDNEHGDLRRALAAYERALAANPNRYRPLAGAAGVAAMLREGKACEYYGRLLALVAPPTPTIQLDGVDPAPCQGHPTTSRPELRAAVAYVKAMCQVA